MVIFDKQEVLSSNYHFDNDTRSNDLNADLTIPEKTSALTVEYIYLDQLR